jgi:hypothetical protein
VYDPWYVTSTHVDERRLSSGMLRRIVSWKLADVSEVLTTSVINLMTETVSTSVTLVTLYEATWSDVQEDSNLHARRRENPGISYVDTMC